MPRFDPARAAFLASRQAAGRSLGQAKYDWRIDRRMMEGMTRAEARGHGVLSARELRETGVLSARANPYQGRTDAVPHLSVQAMVDLRRLTGGGYQGDVRPAGAKSKADRIVEALYGDRSDWTRRQRFAAAFGSPPA